LRSKVRTNHISAVSSNAANEMTRTHRCNRQDNADYNENTAANTLRLVQVKDEMQGESYGDEPVHKAANQNA